MHSFTGGADGSNPSGPLIELPNGHFAGMTFGVGNNAGKPATVFTMTPAGTVTTLYTFAVDSSQGSSPTGLLLASDGNFYGTCLSGGPYDEGTLFQLTPSGQFTKLYNFPSSAGFIQPASLMQGPDGYLYGLSLGGTTNFGAIFRTSLKTRNTTLFFSFFSNDVGPTSPSGGISFGPDGRIYGNSTGYYSDTGAYSPGAAFAIDLTGQLTTLALYDGTLAPSIGTASFPGDGYAYFAGNTGGNGGVCLFGCGSIFRVAMDGSGAELLYSFTGAADGYYPENVLMGTDSMFYGYNIPFDGASVQNNSLFQVNALTGSGVSFLSPHAVGNKLLPPLFQSASGLFRGQAQAGGPSGDGSAFVLNTGAKPVAPQIFGFSPASGPPGTVVTLWGANFVLLRMAALNGSAAEGVANSANFARIIVPATASSGPIEIETAAGSAVTTASFTVQ